MIPHCWLGHYWGSSLVDTRSFYGPCRSGLEAMLWFQQQLTQPSKDQIWAKKEAVYWGKAGGWQLSVGEWRTRLQEGLRGREGGCNQRAPWEEEEISEIQTRKDGKEWDIGELGPGRQGWHPRLCMNNQVSHIVSQVRLRWSPGSQGLSTTMRELTTQGEICWCPHSMIIFQEIFTYNVTDLHPLGANSPPDIEIRKPRTDVVLNL